MSLQRAVDSKKLDAGAAVNTASLDCCWRHFAPTWRLFA